MAPNDRPFSAYPADMRPLRFPTTEATEARTVCNRVADLLEEHLGPRAGLVTAAQDGWEGAFRVEFDETWSPQSQRLLGLKESLRRLVGALEEAAGGVTQANIQRATHRSEYDTDHPYVAARGVL